MSTSELLLLLLPLWLPSSDSLLCLSIASRLLVLLVNALERETTLHNLPFWYNVTRSFQFGPCGCSSTTKTSENCLTLHLPKDKDAAAEQLSILSMLEKLRAGSGYNESHKCDHHAGNGRVSEKVGIDASATVLPVLISRFAGDCSKDCRSVMVNWILGSEYKLVAFVDHHGRSLDSDDAHYTACAIRDGVWYHFNDSCVERVEASPSGLGFPSSTAYLLFYLKQV